jgi:glycosyltransferase A (GT-A) superfamily protein (DUF2064 family)
VALSPAEAAGVAAASLLDTLDAVLAAPVAHRVVALTGDLDRAERADEVRARLARLDVVAQRGEGLGERLAAAHADAHALTGTPLLQIGMDTPQVDADLLTGSARALLAPGTDAVLGDADDGGWWALGVRDPGLAAGLVDVPMSDPTTGAATRASLLAAGARVADLPRLRDVDTPTDLAVVAALAPAGRFAAAVAALGAGAGVPA